MVNSRAEQSSQSGSANRSNTLTTSSLTATSLSGDITFKIQSTVIKFLNSISFDFKLPNTWTIFFHTYLIILSVVIGFPPKYNYGSTIQEVIEYIDIVYTFGLNFSQNYTLYLTAAIIVMVTEFLVLLDLYFVFKAMKNGSKYWKKIKNTARVFLGAITLLSLTFSHIYFVFWDCNYDELVEVDVGVYANVLNPFPKSQIGCWTVDNGTVAIFSLIFLLIQLFLITVYSFVLMEPFTRESTFFLSEDPIYVLIVLAGNQVYLFFINFLPDDFIYIAMAVYFFHSVLTAVYVVYYAPFYKRIENAVITGFHGARTFLPVANLFMQIFNQDNSWDLGLILTVAAIILFILGYIVSFLICFFYHRTIIMKTSYAIEEILDTGTSDFDDEESSRKDVHNLNLNLFSYFIKFALKSDKYNELCHEIVPRIIRNRNDIIPSLYVNMALFAQYLGTGHGITNSNYSIYLLKKALKGRPGFITAFIINYRISEIERSDSDMEQDKKKKRSKQSSNLNMEMKHILDNARRKQEHIKILERNFWKHVTSDEISTQKLLDINYKINSFLYDCKTIFNNLMINFSQEKTVLREYGKFLEEFLHEKEMAEEIYFEANILEEEESKKNTYDNKRLGKTKSTKSNKSHPAGNRASKYLSGNSANRIYPTSEDSKNDIEASKLPKSTSSRFNDQSIHEDLQDEPINEEDLDEALNFEYNNSQTKQEKQKEMYRTNINRRQEQWTFFAFVLSFPIISIVFVISIFITGFVLTQDRERVIILQDVCALPAIPQFAMTEIRTTQRFFNYPNYMPIDFIDNQKKSFAYFYEAFDKISKTDLTVEMMEDLTTLTTHIEVPVERGHNQTIKSTSFKESTVNELLNTYKIQFQNILSRDQDELRLTVEDYTFSFLYLNRDNSANLFKSFCFAALNRNDDEMRIRQDILMYATIGIGIPYLIYFVVYLVFSEMQFYQKYDVSKLFSKIPKDVAGSIYQYMEKQVHNNTIIRVTTPWFTQARLMVIYSFAMFILTALAIFAVIYTSLNDLNYIHRAMLKINEASEMSQSYFRAQFQIGELIAEDSSQLLVNRTQYYDTIKSDMEVVGMDWNSFRYGTVENGFVSMTSFDRDVTSQFETSDNCTDSQMTVNKFFQYLSNNHTSPQSLVECLGLDDLVSSVIPQIDQFNEASYYNDAMLNHFDLWKRVQKLFFDSNAFFSKMTTALELFVQFVYAQNDQIFSQLALALSVAVEFLLLYLLFDLTFSYFAEVQSLRMLFHSVHSDTLDSVEEIRQYIVNDSLPSALRKKVVKKTQSETNQIKEIFDNPAIDPVIIFNTKSLIDLFNPAAEKAFGFRSSEVVGTNVLDLFDGEGADNLKKLITELNTSQNIYGKTLELKSIKKSKKTFPTRCNITRNTVGGRDLITCFMKDITSEKKVNELISDEKKRSEGLLKNILPEAVAAKLKSGETYISESFSDVTIFFSDMVGFTKMSSNMPATELVQFLNIFVNQLDDLLQEHAIEKIKTIGDAYFCVAGLHENSEIEHPERMMRFSIDVFGVMHRYNFSVEEGSEFPRIGLRIGLHTGPVVAGIIGKRKFAYDLWGDTVNMASRMESTGIPDRIQISRQCYERVHDIYEFEERPGVPVKGKGNVTTYLLKEKYHSESHFREKEKKEGRGGMDEYGRRHSSIIELFHNQHEEQQNHSVASFIHEDQNNNAKNDSEQEKMENRDPISHEEDTEQRNETMADQHIN